MSFEATKACAEVLGSVAAIVTLFKGFIEYQKQGSQKRAELFFALEEKFEAFDDLLELLEEDSEALRDHPQKDAFLGFYEEIILLLNSKLVREEVAFYMFAYYAIFCWKSENFWCDLNRDSPYWAAFKDFAIRMKVVEKTFKYSTTAFRV